MRKFTLLMIALCLATTGSAFAEQPALIVGKVATTFGQPELAISTTVKGGFNLSKPEQEGPEFTYTITPVGGLKTGGLSLYITYNSISPIQCYNYGFADFLLSVVNGRVVLTAKSGPIKTYTSPRIPSCGVSLAVDVKVVGDKSVITATAKQ